jgi:Tol biopolymer transport system component
MSPEQARGRAVDRRTDIFAFGAVLYEMLTGHPALGEDVTEILGRVVAVEPDWNRLPSATPPPLRRLLRRALKKDPRQRLADIHDARLEIEEASNAGAHESDAASVLKKRSTGQYVMGAVAAVSAIVALALGGALWAPWRTDLLKPLVRLEVDLGADVALPADAGQSSVILSPDGTRLVYVASVAGAPSRLYARRLDQSKTTELPGTQGAQQPFFSPDGQWIGFLLANKVNKISVEGWGSCPAYGRSHYGGRGVGRGWPYSSGGRPQQWHAPPASLQRPGRETDGLGSGEIAHGTPQFLPGGKFALFSVYQQAVNVDTVTIEAINLSDGKRKVVGRGGTFPRYLPTGHLVYVNKSTLFAIPFDPDKLETSGNAVPILDDVKFQPNTSTPDVSFSRNGTLVYRKGGAGAAPGQTVQWIDATGKRSPLMAKAGAYNNPRISPDAKRMVMQVVEGGGADVWVYDMQRDAMTKLTFGGGITDNPVWTPDGRFIIFTKPGSGMLWTPANGSGQPQLLIEGKGIMVPWSISPDGKRLAFFEVGKADGWIYTAEATEQRGVLKGGKPERFFESKFTDAAPEFSPDGRWIAYQTNESGRSEVVVRAFPAPASGQGGKWLVSTNGGTLVRWSRNSRELLYQEGDRIMAVSYTVNGDSFVADKPRVRIEKLGGTTWDLAPDGHIAVLTPVASPQAPSTEHTVVFLENFFDELRRRVPVGK